MSPRFAFYCHNVHGLGHIVRSARIARAAVDAGATCLLVTGCRTLDRVAIDPRIEVAQLPPVVVRDGRYTAVEAGVGSLDVIRARSERIVDVCRRFAPDVLLADHNPVGLGGELIATLTAARVEGWRTRFVWGVPYADGVLFGPEPPSNPRIRAAIGHYSSAVAYVAEDAPVFAQLPAWALPERRTTVGVIADAPLPPVAGRPGLVVVTSGGGGTAADLCALTLAARHRLPPTLRPAVRLVVGPLGDAAAIQRAADAQGVTDDDVEWLAHGQLQDVIRDASVSVSRAGYNTTSLLLQTSLPLIFVPVHGGSTDQLARMDAVAGLPGVWTIPPDHPDPVTALADALVRASACGPVHGVRLNADGAARTVAWLLAEADRP